MEKLSADSDQLAKYMQPATCGQQGGKPLQIVDYGFKVIQTTSSIPEVVKCDAACPQPSKSARTHSTPRVVYQTPDVSFFFNILCPNEVDDVLTEDVVKHDLFIPTMKPVARAFAVYQQLSFIR